MRLSICFVFFLFILTNCSIQKKNFFEIFQDSANVEKIEINFFPEWNLFQVVGRDLKVSESVNPSQIKKEMEEDEFCSSINSITKTHYGRFFLEDSFALSVECFYIFSAEKMLSFSRELEIIYEEIFSQILHRRTHAQRKGDTLYIVYAGSRLNIIKGACEHRQLINTVVGSYERDGFVEIFNSKKEDVYAFYVLLNNTSPSLVLQIGKDVNKRKDLFLFKNLPIESRNYKTINLSESERSFLR
jgi:hypothetical protein